MELSNQQWFDTYIQIESGEDEKRETRGYLDNCMQLSFYGNILGTLYSIVGRLYILQRNGDKLWSEKQGALSCTLKIFSSPFSLDVNCMFFDIKFWFGLLRLVVDLICKHSVMKKVPGDFINIFLSFPLLYSLDYLVGRCINRSFNFLPYRLNRNIALYSCPLAVVRLT